MSKDLSYEVGYRKPPVHSRFQPGQSGNPSGRPKRRQSFLHDIAIALDSPATGADDAVTKQQVFAANLVNDALARDPLAIKIVAPIALGLADNEADHEDQLTQQERTLIEEYNCREQQAASATTPSREGDDHE
jgi:uncharacterized protein DUF5681